MNARYVTELRRVTAYAREHEDEFVQLITTRQSEKELNKQLRDSNRELSQAESRIEKLDLLIQRLYEDNVNGKISDERFTRMTKTSEDEQKQLESRKAELNSFYRSLQRAAAQCGFLPWHGTKVHRHHGTIC